MNFSARRMFAPSDPQPPRVHQKQPVQLNGDDGRSPDRGDSGDGQPAVLPTKVGGPPIFPWMKQTNFFSRFRINRQNLIALGFVAPVAGHPKILPDRLAFGGGRKDVIDLQVLTGQPLRRQAVPIASRMSSGRSAPMLGNAPSIAFTTKPSSGFGPDTRRRRSSSGSGKSIANV